MEHRDTETQRFISQEDYALLNQLSKKVIGAAIEVHKELGPGLLESVYEDCLKTELLMQGIYHQSQVDVPLIYKGVDTGKSFRIDLFVENTLIVELKAVDALKPVHEVQLVTYLKLADKPIGLLINFNVPVLKDGIKRRINGKIEYTGIKPIRE
jgi:GxxExxY protein